uniref:Interleukin 19 like n=1 Tax=Cyprinus carpio carpio TaxID=630221 RepID=A0A9J7Y5B5_CYPCA
MAFKHDKAKKSERNTSINPWKLLPMSSALVRLTNHISCKNRAENSHANIAIFKISGDDHKGIRLLRKDVMNSIQATESCCFLRQLLHFYMDKVFINYSSSHSLHRRTTSVLANSFLSITKDLRVCHSNAHCECSEDAKQKLAGIQTMYDKLDQAAGAVKAIGELDSLLEWIESFQHH